MNKSHNKGLYSIIILPGLGENWFELGKLQYLIRHFKKKGFQPYILPLGWRDGSEDFTPKLEKITNLVDELSKKGKVSIIGTSAGGSAALNAFLERDSVIEKVINVCGRLHTGDHKQRSLDRMSSTSASFKQSVLLFEKRIPFISDEQKSRIMTVSAKFGDEFVPRDTSTLEGAHNITIPTFEHTVSIAAALSIFSKDIIGFIKSNNN